MKKTKLKLAMFLFLAMISSAMLGVNSVSAFADETETILPSKIEVNYNAEGNCLPSIFSSDYTYNISIYAVSDTEYTQPIAETVGAIYKFDKPGEYALKYTLCKMGTNEISYAYSVISVLDIESPNLFLNGAYKDLYQVGEEVTILDVLINDTADKDLTEYSYKVLLNGEDVTETVENNVLEIEYGSYEVVYSASDNSGNIGTLSVYFSCEDNSKVDSSIGSDNSSSCASSIDFIPLTILGAATILGVLKKRKEN